MNADGAANRIGSSHSSLRRSVAPSLVCVPLVLKQVWRHRTRSVLTVLGGATAMVLFCAVEGMQRGVAAATRATSADTTLVVYRENRFCPFSSNLPQFYESRIARIDG